MFLTTGLAHIIQEVKTPPQLELSVTLLESPNNNRSITSLKKYTLQQTEKLMFLTDVSHTKLLKSVSDLPHNKRKTNLPMILSMAKYSVKCVIIFCYFLGSFQRCVTFLGGTAIGGNQLVVIFDSTVFFCFHVWRLMYHFFKRLNSPLS